MITDVNELILKCTAELEDREYRKCYAQQLKEHWHTFAVWTADNSIVSFDEKTADAYCDLRIGTHLIVPDMNTQDRILLRAMRMLVSFQKDGEFEFRSPSREYLFTGDTGTLIEKFLCYAKDELNRSEATISSYVSSLCRFNDFLERRNCSLEAVTVDVMESFFQEACKTVNARHNHANGIRQLFRFLYSNGYTVKDLSLYILPDNYNRHSKIPTTYTEDEIRKIIDAPDRSSAIGKRDYLVLLLAAEYGWRSADITGFRLDQIDWDKNVIRFQQQKTGMPVEYPLLASVGNAIIDYVQHGRPISERPEVILSAEKCKIGSPLKSPTIHSIVTRYMKKAAITGWKDKKHGAHSLRHSLATNLLKRNISLPVISSVLGHQTTETTKIYLKVDVARLRACTLPMPRINSPFYRNGGDSQ